MTRGCGYGNCVGRENLVKIPFNFDGSAYISLLKRLASYIYESKRGDSQDLQAPPSDGKKICNRLQAYIREHDDKVDVKIAGVTRKNVPNSLVDKKVLETACPKLVNFLRSSTYMNRADWNIM
jgi:hypothetical protein